MTYYDGAEEAGVREKADRSPVTLADEVAHDILVDGLRPARSGDARGLGGGAAAAFEDRRGWRRFWLVDPLDGTKEFIKRRAEFTVNVALIEEGEPVFGVVLAPALELLYWAVKGGGAWREEKGGAAERIYSTAPAAGDAAHGGREPVPPVARAGGVSPDDPGRPAGQGGQLAQVLLGGGGQRRHLSRGSGPTMEWDVAAGDCVYRQSGRDGERPSPLTYNKPDLRNPSFVIGL